MTDIPISSKSENLPTLNYFALAAILFLHPQILTLIFANFLVRSRQMYHCTYECFLLALTPPFILAQRVINVQSKFSIPLRNLVLFHIRSFVSSGLSS